MTDYNSERPLSWCGSRLAASLCHLGVGFVLTWLLLCLNATRVDAQQGADKDVFGSTKVWPLRLEIAPKEYEAMQPPAGGFGFSPPPPAPVPPKDPQRDFDRNLFGTPFSWAQADLIFDGQQFAKVGIRYAGEITYVASTQGLKRPLKMEFGRFVDQKLLGHSSLQLHSMPLDPAKGREALAYSVFRAIGVPASRTAFAEVTLHVPGKYENAYLGLYLVVENVDGHFVQNRFATDGGLLMKPFQVRSFDDLGDDWEAYKPRYQPQTEATKDQARRVIEFAHLVNSAPDDQFQKQAGLFMDVDHFLRFLAANDLVSNLESSFALGHNYFLYLDPKTNKFNFIPADLEFAFASFRLMGTAEQLMDLSLRYPYPGENKLAERTLAIPGNREKYWKLIETLSKTEFTRDRLLNEIEATENLTRQALAKEKQAASARKEPTPAFGPPGAQPPPPPDLRTFVTKRIESISLQLKGRNTGYFPTGLDFGPGAGPLGRGPGASNPPKDAN